MSETGTAGRRRLVWVAAGAAVATEAALVHLGRTYGSTLAERRAWLPGDEVVLDPCVQTDHAITIDAPPSAVWPWLLQMGWGRAGWYSARWVDVLLFPANGPSADRIDPALQDVSVGTFIPDGPPGTGCGFTVEALEPGTALVLRSTSHLPRNMRDRARLDWTWAFVVRPKDGGRRTRFHFRSRWVTSPWWMTLGGRFLVVPADFVMARDMLRGVRTRAEGRG
ncbi:hypothetical protein [Nocardioides sp. Soil805]|uniref:hypothetical protein n=1 Tax=Nocardioides sp. Soil805 TaxID=1736416 RepID=UPI001F4222D7|nr:hypothetical protein [Nocardioides sp. Soil805]